MNSINLFLAVFVSMLLVSCGGRGGGGGGNDNSNLPSSINTAIDSSGGSISLQGNVLTIPALALPISTAVSLSVTSDPAIATRFTEASQVIGPQIQLATTELQITLPPQSTPPSSPIMLKLAVSDAIAASIQQGGIAYVTYLNQFSSDDSEAGEDVENVEGLPADYDSVAKILSVSVPPPAFSDQGGAGIVAVIKILVDTSNVISNGIVQAVSAVSKVPVACSEGFVKGWQGHCFPVEAAIAANKFESPLKGNQLKIVAPYDEPGHGKNGAPYALSHHPGIDFRATVNTPVYAVRSGYIERIMQSQTAGQLVLVRHVDGSATRYLHLACQSLVDMNGSDLTVSQADWVETNMNPQFPVYVGNKIAKSGDTGKGCNSTFPPHLHLEYVYFGSGLCKLPDKSIASCGSVNSITRLGSLDLQIPSGTLVASPYQVSVSQPNQDLLVKATLIDSTGTEILVRRHIANDIFKPVTAQGTNFEGPPPYPAPPLKTAYSNWPIVEVKWNFNDPTITSASKIFPDYTLTDNNGLNTDDGNVNIMISSYPSVPSTVTANVSVTPIVGAVAALPGSTSNAPTPVNFWGGTPGPALTENLSIRLVPVSSYNLTIVNPSTGTGRGTVTSSPSGITCGATCTASFASGSTVILAATADTGSTFTGWSGDCSGTAISIIVTMSESKMCNAYFDPNPPNTYNLTITQSQYSSGTGHVASSPPGILCGNSCTAQFPADSSVTLIATATDGSFVDGWAGFCEDTNSTTSVTVIDPNTWCSVRFDLLPTPPPPSPIISTCNTLNHSPPFVYEVYVVGIDASTDTVFAVSGGYDPLRNIPMDVVSVSNVLYGAGSWGPPPPNYSDPTGNIAIASFANPSTMPQSWSIGFTYTCNNCILSGAFFGGAIGIQCPWP